MMQELPAFSSSSYTSSAIDPSVLALGARRVQAGAMLGGIGAFIGNAGDANQFAKQQGTPMTQSTARIVKVFVADANDNLPLDKRVLYSGDEQLTDLNDQELFFETPIAELLAKHNEVRKVTLDKKQSEKFGRDIYLEPARIRDLRMVVVTVAQF